MKKTKILTIFLTVSVLFSITFLVRLFLKSTPPDRYPSVSTTVPQSPASVNYSPTVSSKLPETELEQQGYQETAEQFVRAYFYQSPDTLDNLSPLKPFCSSKLWDSLIARYGVPSSSRAGQIPYRSEVLKLHIYYDNGETGTIRAVAFVETNIKVGDTPEKTQRRVLSFQLLKNNLVWQVDNILYDQASEQSISAFL